MNKETIEEVAEILYPNGCDGTDRSAEIYRRVFIDGAKHQAERMYSEEKVDLLVNELINNFTDWSGSYIYKDKLIEIHEQLKKK
jgi:hypothetical protein